jgi:hypothetical protein
MGCLAAVLLFLAVLAVTAFVKSALILLPWTATSALLAGWAAYQLGKGGDTEGERVTIGVVATLVLAFAFGYLGYVMITPTARPPRHGLEAVLEFPEPAAADLWQAFPVHLTIWAAVVACVVGRWCYRYRRETEVASVENEAGRGVWIEDRGGEGVSPRRHDGHEGG